VFGQINRQGFTRLAESDNQVFIMLFIFHNNAVGMGRMPFK
jgi:hypothetical protein